MRTPWPWEVEPKCTTCNDTGQVPILDDCGDDGECFTSCWDECEAGVKYERGLM